MLKNMMPSPSHPEQERAQAFLQAGAWESACLTLQAYPDWLEAWGLKLAQAQQLEGAAHFFGFLLRQDPQAANSHHNLGLCRWLQGQVAEAEKAFAQALALNPQRSESHFQLGLLLHESSRWEAALKHYQQAWALRPGYWEACQNGCQILLDSGHPDEAVAWLEAACALPDCPQELWHWLRFYLYAVSADPLRHQQLNQHWEALFMRPLYPTTAPAPPAIPTTVSRRWRVGYLSGDFRPHSATNTYSALFEYANRDHFELHLLATGAEQGNATHWFRAQADHWHGVEKLNESDLADYIASLDLDILVDLAGITGGNRLGVLARQKVPIQLTGFGFGASTGLSCLQGRVTDAALSPPDDPGWNSEPLLYLSQVFHWFPTALHHKAPLSAPPCLSQKPFTLGCGNNPFKFSRACLESWGQLLQALPESRLLLKFSGLEQPHVQSLLRARLQSCGIPVEKVELLGHSSLWEHLHFYNRVDLALDPFPYQGGVSTCEALWMGLPVLCLSGGTRAGDSILTPLGLSEWLTPTPTAYLETALKLAQNREALVFWRQTLRPRLAQSVLCQGEAYCREVEDLYVKLLLNPVKF